jgi:hypothetical protein
MNTLLQTLLRSNKALRNQRLDWIQSNVIISTVMSVENKSTKHKAVNFIRIYSSLGVAEKIGVETCYETEDKIPKQLWGVL